MRRTASPVRGLPAVLMVVCCVAGCGAPSSTVDPARRAAESFRAAVAGGDSGAVCGQLTESTSTSLGQGGTPCPEAVDELGLQDPGTLQGVEVWGRSALARFSAGDVFLSLVNGTWRVAAAGCELTQGQPADCEVGD